MSFLAGVGIGVSLFSVLRYGSLRSVKDKAATPETD